MKELAKISFQFPSYITPFCYIIDKLGDLRNAWLMIFAVSNTLWLILIETLASKGELLATYGSNPVGL